MLRGILEEAQMSEKHESLSTSLHLEPGRKIILKAKL